MVIEFISLLLTMAAFLFLKGTTFSYQVVNSCNVCVFCIFSSKLD